jgi:MFS family permease
MASQQITSSDFRSLWLASLGGALEFYDFVIFVFFTDVIGKLFFAATTAAWVSQVGTFGIFAVGYLARPLGGIIMAHYGDTVGRKRVFTLSIFLMAAPTLLIGLLPTYHSAGASALLLLVALRILQGIAIGGEAPGGWVFVAEHASADRTGFAVGLLTSGLSVGILLGSLVTATLHLVFSQAQILGGIWRLPFFLGGVFGFAALVLRRRLKETPVFREISSRAAAARELPLRHVLRRHRIAVLLSILGTWTLTAEIVVVILMSPVLLQKLTHVSPASAQLANLAGTAALCVSTVLVGIAADRFGVRRTALPALALLVGGAYALYVGVLSFPGILAVLYTIAGLGAGAVTLIPLMMVRAFPPLVRYTGVSFSYNLAYSIAGGLTPSLVAWLFHFNRLGPAHYVAFAAFLGAVALLAAPTAQNDVSPASEKPAALTLAD